LSLGYGHEAWRAPASPSPVNRGLPASVTFAFGWTLSAAFLLSLLLSASVAIRPSSATDLVQLGGIEALVFVLSIMWVLRVHGGDAPLGPSLGLRPTHPALLGLGVCLGFTLHFPAEFVDGLVQRFLPDSGEQIATEAGLLSASTPARLVLVLVVIACVGPFVEELFFRGALYGALRRSYSLGVTTTVVAACFVVGHLNAHRWPALALIAFALTYLRAASGSLLPALALHVTFNAVTVLAFVAGPPPIGTPRIEPMPLALGSVATAGLLLMVRYVAVRAPVARRGRAEDVD
jgi:membrane protease YdiL (CAAX protease family)